MWRNQQCVWDIEYVIGFFFSSSSVLNCWFGYLLKVCICFVCVPAVLHGHWLEGRWVCGWALWQHNNGICLLEDMVWYPSEECQWEWRGNNREVAGTGKKKQNRTSDWKSMTFRIIYMTVIYCGLVLLWGWEGGPFCFVCFFSPTASFVIHIFIPHSTFGQFFNYSLN